MGVALTQRGRAVGSLPHPVSEPDDQPVVTASPAQAARMLHISRETVHRWCVQGKLPFILEANKQGREVRRIPVAAIDALLVEGIRDVLPRGAAPPLRAATTAQPPPLPTNAEVAELRERLLIEAETAATMRARLDDMQAVVRGAIERMREAEQLPWWKRGTRRDRDAEARAAIMQLGDIPAAPRDDAEAGQDAPEPPSGG